MNTPNQGQFVALWSVNSQPFSATFKVEDNQLKCYDSFNDFWWPACDHGFSMDWLKKVGANFFVGAE